jgi:hypothetical protein
MVFWRISFEGSHNALKQNKKTVDSDTLLWYLFYMVLNVCGQGPASCTRKFSQL